MADNRYQIVPWRGFSFDRYTQWNILRVEDVLGFVLRVVQGSYNKGGVAASAGTHDGGGAVDFSVRGMTQATIARVVKALRKQGFAAWYRPPNWDGRGGGPHIHAELIGNTKASAGAKSQWSAYRRFLNGLANNGRDLSWHPALIRSAPYKPVVVRLMTFNLPGEDKIPNGAKRIARAMKVIKPSKPHLIGWNELVGIQSATHASVWARAVDTALGAGWNLVNPTRFLNENYISYDSKILKLVHQYGDSILESKSGGRHLTRTVFQVRGTDFVFAVGQTHFVNGDSSQAQADRHSQAKDALASIRAVSKKHDDCPFVIMGDLNMRTLPGPFVAAKLKNARLMADTASNRDATTYTNYAKTKPSQNTDWILDQIWFSPDFYVNGYTVRQDISRGVFRKPRPADHQPIIVAATGN